MRRTKTFCSYCGSTRLEVGAAFCDRCEQPTEWASYDDRVRWELDRWAETRSAGLFATAEAPARRRPGFLDRLRRSNNEAPAPEARTLRVTSSADPARPAARAPRREETRAPARAPRTASAAPARSSAVEPVQQASSLPVPDPQRVAEILARLASYAADPDAARGNASALDDAG